MKGDARTGASFQAGERQGGGGAWRKKKKNQSGLCSRKRKSRMEINNFSAAPQRRGESNKARTVARRRSIREQDGGSVSDAPPARCHAEATAAFPSLLLLLLLPPYTQNTPTALFSPVTSSRSAASDWGHATWRRHESVSGGGSDPTNSSDCFFFSFPFFFPALTAAARFM